MRKLSVVFWAIVLSLSMSVVFAFAAPDAKGKNPMQPSKGQAPKGKTFDMKGKGWATDPAAGPNIQLSDPKSGTPTRVVVPVVPKGPKTYRFDLHVDDGAERKAPNPTKDKGKAPKPKKTP